MTTCGHEQTSSNDIVTDRVIRKFMKMDMSEIWITDSGASCHMTYHREWFHTFIPANGAPVVLGNNETCNIKGSGTILVQRYVSAQWVSGKIENVLYVPNLRKNLFSVGVCTTKGFSIIFEDRMVKVSLNNMLIAQGAKQGNEIYRMLMKVVICQEANVLTTSNENLQLWHERAGHVNVKTLQSMVNKGLVNGVKIEDKADIFCEACQLGKAHVLPFKQKSEHRQWQLGEFFHSDLCGPMSVDSLGGSRYFIAFKDDFSGYRYVYFLKHKSDVYDVFKKFERLIYNKFNRSMKVLHTDNGREYCNRLMSKYLSERGIKLETTAPYTPQQNGRSERDNRTIVESARTMLLHSQAPLHLWAEAISTAVYALNMTSTRRRPDITPLECWTGMKPDYSHLRVFGSLAFDYIPKFFRKKLDQKSKKVIFIGYEKDSKNYRLYDPETRKVSVGRNVIFAENRFCDAVKTAESSIFSIAFPCDDQPTNNIQATDTDAADTEARDVAEDEGKADQLNAPDTPDQIQPEDDQQQQVGDSKPHPTERRLLRNRDTIKRPERYEINFAEYYEPNSYQEAISGPDADKWKAAIHEELLAHSKNETWTLTAKPKNRSIIDSKWVFKVQEEGRKRKSI